MSALNFDRHLARPPRPPLPCRTRISMAGLIKVVSSGRGARSLAARRPRHVSPRPPSSPLARSAPAVCHHLSTPAVVWRAIDQPEISLSTITVAGFHKKRLTISRKNIGRRRGRGHHVLEDPEGARGFRRPGHVLRRSSTSRPSRSVRLPRRRVPPGLLSFYDGKQITLASTSRLPHSPRHCLASRSSVQHGTRSLPHEIETHTRCRRA